MRAQVNTIFSGIFRVNGESAATLTAYVMSDADALLATKTVDKRESGYLFSHVFTTLGVHTVKVEDSSSNPFYSTVTVYEDLTETGVRTALTNQGYTETRAAALDNLDMPISGIAPAGIPKNQDFSDFPFNMVLSSDGKTAAIGKAITGAVSLDGGPFQAVTGVLSEVSGGSYQFDALAADTNGGTVVWRFSAADCDDNVIEFLTS